VTNHGLSDCQDETEFHLSNLALKGSLKKNQTNKAIKIEDKNKFTYQNSVKSRKTQLVQVEFSLDNSDKVKDDVDLELAFP